MGDTSIEWTDKTWNPIRGCSRVSEGCRHCYAEQVAGRFSGEGQAYHGLARRRSNGEAQWAGEVRVIENHMLDPLSWRTPSRVFVNSMSDLFHEKLADDAIDRVFAVMALAPRHTFQILTKRPERMLEWSNTNATGGRIFHLAQQIDPKGVGALSGAWPLPNVWLGVSTENQATADERIPLLLQTPSAVRFLSCEPLLGPIDLKDCGTTPYFTDRGCLPDRPGTSVDWVIVGGESGRGARPCDVEWITDLVAQCDFAGVACFVKQLGSAPGFKLENEERRGNMVPSFHHFDAPSGLHIKSVSGKGGDMAEWPEELRVREFPRAANSEGK
jgi:protein gp37